VYWYLMMYQVKMTLLMMMPNWPLTRALRIATRPLKHRLQHR